MPAQPTVPEPAALDAPQPQEPPAPAGTLTAVVGVPDLPACPHCHRPTTITVPANDGVPPW